jgi:hypothetical protein
MGGRLSSDSVLAMFWVMEGAAYLITDDLELLDGPARGILHRSYIIAPSSLGWWDKGWEFLKKKN